MCVFRRSHDENLCFFLQFSFNIPIMDDGTCHIYPYMFPLLILFQAGVIPVKGNTKCNYAVFNIGNDTPLLSIHEQHLNMVQLI